MRDRDSTEKDARPPTASKSEAPLAEKELSDEQIAAISGGAISEGTKAGEQIDAVRYRPGNN